MGRGSWHLPFLFSQVSRVPSVTPVSCGEAALPKCLHRNKVDIEPLDVVIRKLVKFNVPTCQFNDIECGIEGITNFTPIRGNIFIRSRTFF